ncbi:unnamed protein product [Vitrella brassicaformis CCMP3155]|uniref:Uncharacterized protein n=1 Tax=Vitrella brassicaformis (strain CCMP3155) TaxID=1169540 RepID=A0A0G4ECE6_VITBC|nr:unnamed protein product [Vitrella brassicaformis CCMP3155]|eukprot:CEL93611.1 unnamed protein product [Vitrella brassicaformis CCMP3155]
MQRLHIAAITDPSCFDSSPAWAARLEEVCGRIDELSEDDCLRLWRILVAVECADADLLLKVISGSAHCRHWGGWEDGDVGSMSRYRSEALLVDVVRYLEKGQLFLQPARDAAISFVAQRAWSTSHLSSDDVLIFLKESCRAPLTPGALEGAAEWVADHVRMLRADQLLTAVSLLLPSINDPSQHSAVLPAFRAIAEAVESRFSSLDPHTLLHIMGGYALAGAGSPVSFKRLLRLLDPSFASMELRDLFLYLVCVAAAPSGILRVGSAAKVKRRRRAASKSIMGYLALREREGAPQQVVRFPRFDQRVLHCCQAVRGDILAMMSGRTEGLPASPLPLPYCLPILHTLVRSAIERELVMVEARPLMHAIAVALLSDPSQLSVAAIGEATAGLAYLGYVGSAVQRRYYTVMLERLLFGDQGRGSDVEGAVERLLSGDKPMPVACQSLFRATWAAMVAECHLSDDRTAASLATSAARTLLSSPAVDTSQLREAQWEPSAQPSTSSSDGPPFNPLWPAMPTSQLARQVALMAKWEVAGWTDAWDRWIDQGGDERFISGLRRREHQRVAALLMTAMVQPDRLKTLRRKKRVGSDVATDGWMDTANSQIRVKAVSPDDPASSPCPSPCDLILQDTATGAALLVSVVAKNASVLYQMRHDPTTNLRVPRRQMEHWWGDGADGADGADDAGGSGDSLAYIGLNGVDMVRYRLVTAWNEAVQRGGMADGGEEGEAVCPCPALSVVLPVECPENVLRETAETLVRLVPLCGR